MASNFWIKLYHEILHDPKMGMLPDNVWRRCLEIFLLAGELDNDGQLPDTPELAWMLRQANLERFEAELEHLERVNILTRLTDGWLVTNFTKRQGVIDTAERSRAYRERKRIQKLDTPPSQTENEHVTLPSRTSHEPVTQSVTLRDTDIDKESSPKGDSDSSPKLFEEEFLPELAEQAEPLPLETLQEAPPEQSQPRPDQAMFSALAKVCRMDLEIITDKDRGKLNQFEKRMRTKGYKPGDVTSFESWWYDYTWQGQKDQAPSLDELYKHWGQYLAFLKGEKGGSNPKNGARTHPPPSRASPKLSAPVDNEKIKRLLDGLE